VNSVPDLGNDSFRWGDFRVPRSNAGEDSS